MTNMVEKYISRLRNEDCVVVAGVGCGLTAKAAVRGGADILGVYNTAVYRIQGVPTAMAFLPYDDCNALTLAHAPQVIAVAGDKPVVLGFGAHDPRRSLDGLLDCAEELGAAGVTNEPFIGMYGGDLRRQMEHLGLGFERELQLISKAVKRGMLALGWVFTPEEAKAMVETGCAIIGIMVGGVTSGRAAGGVAGASLEESVVTINEIIVAIEAAVGSGERPLILIHGGPLNDPSSVETALQQTGADGYVTGSTGERIPVEQSVAAAIASFKRLPKGAMK